MYKVTLWYVRYSTFFFTLSEIQLELDRSIYRVNETDGKVENLISVKKTNNRLTEQELNVFLVLSVGSGYESAELGQHKNTFHCESLLMVTMSKLWLSD